MAVTKMIRYDDHDNIVFEKRSTANGGSFNNRKDLEYDDKGNIISIHEIVTLVDPHEPQPTIISDTITEFEYQDYCGKNALTKVVENGLIQQKSEYRKKYIASNGDEEDDSTATVYIYSDYVDPETGKKVLANIISFDTFQLTDEALEKVTALKYISEDIQIPDGFDTFSVQTEGKDSVKLETVKVTYGNSNTAAYTKITQWSDEGIGYVVESFFVEDQDRTEDQRYFNEYTREYKIDIDYNIIETIVEKDLLAEVTLGKNSYCAKKVVNDQTGLPFYFYNLIEEREYGFVEVSMSEDSDHEVIARTERLNGEIINQIYVRVIDDKKIYYTPKITEYEQIGVQWLKSMIMSTDENGAFVKENYVYDPVGRIMLRTIHRKDVTEDKEEVYESHIIYKYDNTGKCVAEISENNMITYLYDSHGRKSFEIINANYPMSKEIFDLHFNELLDTLE